MAFISVDPRGTYLNVPPTDAANAPTTVLLSTLGLVPGDVITLSRNGTWQGNAISPDDATWLLAVFSGAGGLIAPATYLTFTTPLQFRSTTESTDVIEDFLVVGPGVTTVTIPAGATSLKFSPNDTFFEDNTDPDGDYGVEVLKLDGTTSFANHDLIFGTTGPDSLLGGLGGDTLWGGAGDDTLRGQEGWDSVDGGAGNDLVDGGLRDDTLWGGAGDDTLLGQEGADRLYGGAGNDLVDGGFILDRITYSDGNSTSYRQRHGHR